jgi:hypothetical protein
MNLKDARIAEEQENKTEIILIKTEASGADGNFLAMINLMKPRESEYSLSFLSWSISIDLEYLPVIQYNN